MQAPARQRGPGGESRPGLGRRGFLSAGGGILAGAGALGLSRPPRPQTAPVLAGATRTGRNRDRPARRLRPPAGLPG